MHTRHLSRVWTLSNFSSKTIQPCLLSVVLIEVLHRHPLLQCLLYNRPLGVLLSGQLGISATLSFGTTWKKCYDQRVRTCYGPSDQKSAMGDETSACCPLVYVKLGSTRRSTFSALRLFAYLAAILFPSSRYLRTHADVLVNKCSKCLTRGHSSMYICQGRHVYHFWELVFFVLRNLPPSE